MLTTQPVLPRALRAPHHVRRWAAIVALVLALLAGSVTVSAVSAVSHDNAGAMPNGVNCVLGGLAGVGSVALLVAAPPAGIFEVVVTGGLGIVSAISIGDACGSWVTEDLSGVVHFYGRTGGGGSW